MLNLRPYQQEASEAVFREWQEFDSTLLVMPTGCGKTITFVDIAEKIINETNKRVLILAHREELIFQAKEKLQRHTKLNVDVEMGNYKALEKGALLNRAQVIVSSIQTQTAGGDGGGRMGKFNPEDFALVIVDECHRAVSPSYRRCLEYYRTNPKLKILGVTATPDRADESALGQVFESNAFDYEILDAIHDGWLVPVEQQMVHINGLDYSSIRTQAGDLNTSDLEAVMMAEKNLQGVASSSIDILGSRSAIAFTSSVAHAQTLSDIFNRHRAGMSSWICAKTDKDKRKQILADFKSGKLQAVCNCGVLGEGYDNDRVEVIIMAKPTKSRCAYAQMVGRAIRPLEGLVDPYNFYLSRRHAIAKSKKPACLIVDFSGNSGRHKLVTTADILGGKVSKEAIAGAATFARQHGKPVRMDKALDEQEELIREREERRIAAEARKASLVAKADYNLTKVDPFELLHIKPVVERGWDKDRQFSEKQRAMLHRNGVDPDKITFAAGKQLMNAIGARIEHKLCSLGQMKVLKKYSLDTNVTFEHASRMIDAIAKNGWKVPQELPKAIVTESEPEKVAVAFEDDVPF